MSTVGSEKLLDRAAASRFLKVSTRTLDRYIRSGKLSSQNVDGRVWLLDRELRAFKSEGKRPRIVSGIDIVDSDLSTVLIMDKVDSSRHFSQDSVDILSSNDKSKKGLDSGVFEDLYKQTKEELNEKQERLEIANYRVGQLENQLKNTMPLLKYHHENFEHQKVADELKSQVQELEIYAKNLSYKIKYEKFSKRILTIILLILFALQPLWVIFFGNN